MNELAAALGLTDNAVRAHLLSLERDGLAHQSGTQPGFRKPHATYALTAEAEQIFPKSLRCPARSHSHCHFKTVDPEGTARRHARSGKESG